MARRTRKITVPNALPLAAVARRRKIGLNQAALAEAVGVSQGTISGFENGKSWPDIQKLAAIANELGFADWREMFDRPGNENPNYIMSDFSDRERAIAIEMLRGIRQSRPESE